jgi:hypothetical protein
MVSRTDAPPRNRLLTSLPPGELRWLEPYLERAELGRGYLVRAVGEQIDSIWFPETAVISLRVTLAGGGVVESGHHRL